MPIGSHHTWWGLLFVKGMVGFLAYLVPFAVHALRVTVDATLHPRGRLPLGIILTMLLLSFGENIEIQVYLLWPALVALGIHLREMAVETSASTSAEGGESGQTHRVAISNARPVRRGWERCS